MTENLAIGAVSRATGLSVSALRFYDREGVFVPASTDPHTGYRRYSSEQVGRGRMLAALRLAGMPIADLRAALEADGDAESLAALIAAHRDRLDVAHAAALRALDRVEREASGSSSITVPAGALRRALGGVRHAVGAPEPFPVLAGILLDRDDDGVRVVATDRFRLAMHTVEGALGGPAAQVVLPQALVERVLQAADAAGPAHVTAEPAAGLVRCRIGDHAWDAVALVGAYPDHRALLPLAGAPSGEVVDSARVLEELLAAQETRGYWDLSAEVAVDRGYLWDAVHEVGAGEVVLPRPGEFSPVVVRALDDAMVALVMPVRPQAEPAPASAVAR